MARCRKSDYLTKINPLIQEIGEIHQQYEQGLASSVPGVEVRRDTSENLAPATEAPRGVRQMPLLLTPFHRDTNR